MKENNKKYVIQKLSAAAEQTRIRAAIIGCSREQELSVGDFQSSRNSNAGKVSDDENASLRLWLLCPEIERSLDSLKTSRQVQIVFHIRR